MKVAIQRKEMTPTVPMYMAGHAIRVEKNIGVLDPLYCTTMLVEEQTTLCFVTLDVVMVDEEYTQDVREQIAKELNIPVENVYVSFLHNHSGPEFTHLNPFTKTREHAADLEYLAWVKGLILETVEACKESFVSVSAYHSNVEIDGFYGNRNGIHIPCDKEIGLVKFVDEDKKTIAAFMNMPCHGTVLGSQNLYISADLPGAIRSKLEEAFDTTMCVFIGAAGDMGNRQYRQASNAEELERTSTGIVEQLLAKVDWKPLDLQQIEVYPYEYIIDYERDLEAVRKNIDLTEAELQTEIPYGRRQLLTSGIAIQKGQLAADPHVHISIKGTIIHTKEAMIVTIPAELFNRFGLEMKQSVDKQVYIFGYTNYSIGYMVEEAEWGKNYESLAANIQKGDPEKYTAFIVERMKEIDRG